MKNKINKQKTRGTTSSSYHMNNKHLTRCVMQPITTTTTFNPVFHFFIIGLKQIFKKMDINKYR